MGFRVSRITADLLAQAKASWPARLPEIEAAMRGGDVMSSTIAALKGKAVLPDGIETEMRAETMMEKRTTDMTATAENGPRHPPSSSGSRWRVSGGMALAGVARTAPAVTEVATALETEAIKLQMPIIYDGLDERGGAFSRGFLDDAGGTCRCPR